MYEVNKFGCYLNQFISYIYLSVAGTALQKKFKLRTNPIFTSRDYERLVNMDFHKSVEFEISAPKKMLKEFQHKNGAMAQIAEGAAELDSFTAVAKFEVASVKKGSKPLSQMAIKEVVDEVKHILTTPFSRNLEKVVLKGYEGDSRKLSTLELIANRFEAFINLDEPRQNNNLLENQRRAEILRVHNDSETEYINIFGPR